ncbi:MAG: transcriptional repressor [Deltaproteobacteria bacterium]|nr:transcriptional repressor [Deltaproteobacteria bacterium]MCB9488478.1 transcriptional repressor [Deltaproteobacteria bacterium]
MTQAILMEAKEPVDTESALERFQEFLATQNLRMTKERRIVVEEVFQEQHHFTVSELLERLRGKDKALGRSTVYRVIPLLLQSGLLFEVSVKGGREEQVYENTLSPRHHNHLTCDLCNAVIEFEDEGLYDLQKAIAGRYGYKLRRHVLHLRGICPKCQEKIIDREVNAW